MAHGGQRSLEQPRGIEIEHEMQALHEMPGGHAVAEQDQQKDEQQRHHDSQAFLEPGDHALGDHPGRQRHEHRVPEDHPPGIVHQRAEQRRATLGGGALEVAAPDAEDVIQRPAADHAVERKDQQRGDHPGEGRPGPDGRMPGGDRQLTQRVRRTLPRAPADQGFGEHHRQTDQRDAGKEHQHEGAAAVDAGHVGEFPDAAQTNRGTGSRENEHPATGPAAVH